jgi:hypothetical protein
VGYSRGLYFGPKIIFIPPPTPPVNDIFFPLATRHFTTPHGGLFALILPYFAIILPFYFLFSHFLSPSFPLSSFFFPLSSFFFYIFLFFLFAFSYFFPQMTSADIFPPGGRSFPIYRPLGYSRGKDSLRVPRKISSRSRPLWMNREIL